MSTKHEISLSAVAGMGRVERKRALAGLAQAAAAPRNGQAADINAQIKAYEEHYGFSSAALGSALNSGKLDEDENVAKWMMLLSVRRAAIR